MLFIYVVGLCHCCVARSEVMGGGDGLHIWKVTAVVLNKQLQTASKSWPSSLGVGWEVYSSLPLKISTLQNVTKELRKYWLVKGSVLGVNCLQVIFLNSSTCRLVVSGCMSLRICNLYVQFVPALWQGYLHENVLMSSNSTVWTPSFHSLFCFKFIYIPTEMWSILEIKTFFAL